MARIVFWGKVLFNIIMIALLVPLFYVAFSFDEWYFDDSVKLIKEWQQHESSITIEISKMVSTVGLGVSYIIGIVMFGWAKRSRAYYYLLLFVAQVYSQAITKMIYHEPRPYMTDPDVQVYECSSEFGTPSGHLVLCAPIFLAAFLDYYFSDWGKFWNSNKLLFSMFGVLDLGFLCFVIWSRMYNGAHTFDQLLFGFLLSAWIAVYFHFAIKPPLCENIDRLHLDRGSVTTCNYITYFSVSTGLFLCLTGLLTMVYEVVDATVEIPEEWVANTELQCGHHDILESFHHASYVQSGLCTIGYSCYLGILFQSRFIRDTQEGEETFRTKFLQALVYTLFALIYFVPLGFVGYDLIPNVYALLYLTAFIPGLIGGFLGYAYSEKLGRKFRTCKEIDKIFQLLMLNLHTLNQQIQSMLIRTSSRFLLIPSQYPTEVQNAQSQAQSVSSSAR